MGLKDKLVAAPPEGATQVRPHIRVRGVEVDAVDAALLHLVNKFLHGCIGLVYQPLAAHADLTDPKASAAQYAVFHVVVLLFFYFVAA